MVLLNLNDGHTFIEGRPIRMDVASARTPKKYPEIDGSQFRGGKYSRNQSKSSTPSGSSTAAPAPSTLSRNKSSASGDGSLGRNKSMTPADPVPPSIEKQRPTLKLLPRSKPADGDGNEASKAADIFGGAKPRDESRWAPAKANTANNNFLILITGHRKRLKMQIYALAFRNVPMQRKTMLDLTNAVQSALQCPQYSKF